MNNERKTIRTLIHEWYNQHKRDLPWRHTHDAYKIWLSEVILQQTRVGQGYNYYLRFAEKYPTVNLLADAEEEEILKLWQGLGYYSRARNLHSSAKRIISDFDGVFPHNYKDIRSLKGVGDYTAAAIASFAFNLPYAAVDGNVYRVLSRIYGENTPIDTSRGKKGFDKLAANLLDRDKAGLHNQAMMEFGSLQCVPVSPDCNYCPLKSYCIAHKLDMVDKLPVKQGKVKTRNRYFNYLDIRSDDKMVLEKRTNTKDIWQGLYQLPLIETEKSLSLEKLLSSTKFKILAMENMRITPSLSHKHVLSHQILHTQFYRIEIEDLDAFQDNYTIISEKDLDLYPVPRLLEIYFEKKATMM